MTDFQKEEDKALMFYALMVLDNEQLDITQNGLNYSLFCEDGFIAYDLFDCIRQRAITADAVFSTATQYITSMNLLQKIAALSDQPEAASNVQRILDFFTANKETLEELIEDNKTGKFVGNSDEEA